MWVDGAALREMEARGTRGPRDNDRTGSSSEEEGDFDNDGDEAGERFSRFEVSKCACLMLEACCGVEAPRRLLRLACSAATVDDVSM